MQEMKRCSRCIMDNISDKEIYFDENGHCNYCNNAIEQKNNVYFPGPIILGKGNKRLDNLIAEIKEKGRGKEYDCIMGLSGGLDSSYLAYLGYLWGLRVFAVHIDDGYDTDISKSNLEKLIKATGFHYEVITPDPEQFNDLNLAYLKAGVPNIAAPQDNILFAFLYKKMKEHRIKYFLSGGNFALECILQQGNSYKADDVVNIRDIHRRFGTQPISNLRFISSFEKYLDKKLKGIKSPRPLNLIDYNRERAFKELKDFCEFEYYGRKHLENIWTAFAQLYWFPQKFNVDKRTSHLSSMIISNQITREEALKELSEPLFDETMMNSYISIIKDKLHISDSEFEIIMKAPSHQHNEYKTENDLVRYRIWRSVLKMKNRIFERIKM